MFELEEFLSGRQAIYIRSADEYAQFCRFASHYGLTFKRGIDPISELVRDVDGDLVNTRGIKRFRHDKRNYYVCLNGRLTRKLSGFIREHSLSDETYRLSDIPNPFEVDNQGYEMEEM